MYIDIYTITMYIEFDRRNQQQQQKPHQCGTPHLINAEEKNILMRGKLNPQAEQAYHSSLHSSQTHILR